MRYLCAILGFAASVCLAAPDRLPDVVFRDLADVPCHPLGPAEKAPRGTRKTTDGRRHTTMPLIEIARTRTKEEALAALDVWRGRYPAAAVRLQPADILVDGMRGPSSIWYRIRINLQHVPEDQRPPQEPLLADYSPWENYSGGQAQHGATPPGTPGP